MKDATKLALDRMYRLTEPKCATCPGVPKTRCCSKLFCEMAEVTMRELGGSVEKTDHPTLPYMGPNGCVIPPHLRPGCTGFICDIHLQNPGFRSKWEALQERLNKDPNLVRAMSKARDAIGGLEGGIKRLEEEATKGND